MNRDSAAGTGREEPLNPEMMQLGYLTQTVAGVLQAVGEHLERRSTSASLFRRIKVLVCNVDQNPQRYSEAAALDDVVEVVTRYRNATEMRQSRAFAAQVETAGVLYNANARYYI
jgi:hypothetical protein